MPEIEFLIDTETGECQTEIKGIAGAACEKTAQQLKKSCSEVRVWIRRQKNTTLSRKLSGR